MSVAIENVCQRLIEDRNMTTDDQKDMSEDPNSSTDCCSANSELTADTAMSRKNMNLHVDEERCRRIGCTLMVSLTGSR